MTKKQWLQQAEATKSTSTKKASTFKTAHPIIEGQVPQVVPPPPKIFPPGPGDVAPASVGPARSPKQRAAELCGRLKLARERAFGTRGRSTLARALGLNPSTYTYYEVDRVPTPEVLAKAAELTGVNIEWLISGLLPRERQAARVASEQAAAGLDPQLQGALGRLMEGGGSGAAVKALADLLRLVQQQFPSQNRDLSEDRLVEDTERMVPVIGRTAAGLVADYKSLLGDQPATTVAAVAAKAVGQFAMGFPARAIEADDPQYSMEAPSLEHVALIQLDAPLESGVVEFVDLPDFRSRWHGAFAMRVDGDSMRPRFRHGDLVIAVPGQTVRAGQAALVQIRGRIGVTLKLIRRENDCVHLVPINESYESESIPATEIEWLARVMFAVRV